MVFNSLMVCCILGMFPFRFHRKKLIVSKFGFVANVCSTLILVFDIVKLLITIAVKIQNHLTFTFVQFIIRILNSVILSVILIRRNVHASCEAKTLSTLFAPRLNSNREVIIVFLFSFCVLFVEFALFAYFQTVLDDNVLLYEFTLLLRVTFEFQMVVVLVCEERLYETSNKSLQTVIVTDTSTIYAQRMRYEQLHCLRSSTTDVYSFDMFLYLSSSQLCMLLVCFDMTEQFSDNESTRVDEIILECLRFLRLLGGMSYVIWMWDRVSKKCADTLKCSFQYDGEKSSFGVSNQIMMLVNDIQLRNKTFCANKYFDINMSLLNNISSTIFAYFALIITSKVSQQRAV